MQCCPDGHDSTPAEAAAGRRRRQQRRRSCSISSAAERDCLAAFCGAQTAAAAATLLSPSPARCSAFNCAVVPVGAALRWWAAGRASNDVASVFGVAMAAHNHSTFTIPWPPWLPPRTPHGPMAPRPPQSAHGCLGPTIAAGALGAPLAGMCTPSGCGCMFGAPVKTGFARAHTNPQHANAQSRRWRRPQSHPAWQMP